MRSSAASLLSLFVFVAACGGGDGEAEIGADGTAEAAGASSSDAQQSSGQAATTIHLVVGGGPQAGTYDATSADITCTHGFAGPGSWGNQYSVAGGNPGEFSSLQLIVPDTEDAADGTGTFLLTAGFGPLMDTGYVEHTIDTGATLGGTDPNKEHKGTGTVTVDDRGQSGKVTFSGTTEDNVTLEGTIDCHRLMRGGE